MHPAQNYWFATRRNKPVMQVRSSDLADAASDVNTSGKYPRKLVTDLDTLTLYAALGTEPTDAWRPVGVADDSADITPA